MNRIDKVIGEEELTRTWLLEKPGDPCHWMKTLLQRWKEPAMRYGLMARGILTMSLID